MKKPKRAARKYVRKITPGRSGWGNVGKLVSSGKVSYPAPEVKRSYRVGLPERGEGAGRGENLRNCTLLCLGSSGRQVGFMGFF